MKYKKYTDEEKALRKELISKMKKELNIVEVASNLLGLNITKDKRLGKSRYLKTEEHGSLVFDMQKNCAIWNAHGNEYLNCIDFYMLYNQCDGNKAINDLLEYFVQRDPLKLELYEYDAKEDDCHEYSGLVLPDIAKNNDKAFYYLTEQRAINAPLVEKLMEAGKIYQDTYNNVVFVEKDCKDKSTPRFGFRRGTGEIKFQKDLSGSFKLNGFIIENNVNIKKLVLCESVIDGLSYASLCYVAKSNHLLDSHVLCSSGAGCALSTLIYNLLNNSNLKNIEEIEVLLDYDLAGQNATKKIENYFKNSNDFKKDETRKQLIEKFPLLFKPGAVTGKDAALYKTFASYSDMETASKYVDLEDIKDLNEILQKRSIVEKKVQELKKEEKQNIIMK